VVTAGVPLPGHPSRIHGQVASRCGPVRPPAESSLDSNSSTIVSRPTLWLRPHLACSVHQTSSVLLLRRPRHLPSAWCLPPAGRPWSGSWEWQSLANSFSTMTLQPLASVTDWGAYSGTSIHTTPYADSISRPYPPSAITPSAVLAGNGSTLPVTTVGDMVLPGPFYINDILHTHVIIHNLLFVCRFTTDNSVSMEFDPFGLFIKDLATRSVIISPNRSGPLYTLHILGSSPSHVATPCAMSVVGLSPLPPSNTFLAIPAPMSCQAYLALWLSDVTGALLIFVMHVSWVNILCCLLLVFLIEHLRHLS
jgi:hypothetical protein